MPLGIIKSHLGESHIAGPPHVVLQVLPRRRLGQVGDHDPVPGAPRDAAAEPAAIAATARGAAVAAPAAAAAIAAAGGGPREASATATRAALGQLNLRSRQPVRW